MGRLARSQVLYDGCYAHVFTRSLEKRRILEDNEDFDRFNEVLLRIKAKHNF